MQSNEKDKYICPICCEGMIWDDESDADDCGYVEPGIVSFWHCEKCNVSVEVFVPDERE